MMQSGIPLNQVLLLAASLFTVGLVGVMVRRNMLYILMSLEIMLNACGLAFIGAGAHWGQADGQIMFLMILTLAAAEVSIGIGLLLQVHRRYRTLDVDTLNEMRG